MWGFPHYNGFLFTPAYIYDQTFMTRSLFCLFHHLLSSCKMCNNSYKTN